MKPSPSPDEIWDETQPGNLLGLTIQIFLKSSKRPFRAVLSADYWYLFRMTRHDDSDPSHYMLCAEIHDDNVIHGKEIWNNLEILEEGAHGIVYLQGTATGSVRAVKKISRDLMRVNKFNKDRELGTMIAVRQYNDIFVQLYGWFEDKNYLYLAMEFVPCGNLGDYLKTHRDETKSELIAISTQLLIGLTILHSLKICHRDLKPQNVLIASKRPIQLKLADFGISKSTEGTELRTTLGTQCYMAPELLGALPRELRIADRYYDNSIDIWAFGCLLFEMVTGDPPFLEVPVGRRASWDASGLDSGVVPDISLRPAVDGHLPVLDLHLLIEYCYGRAEFPIVALEAADASATLKFFITRLLRADPRARMSASEALNDEWITGQHTTLDLSFITFEASEALNDDWITGQHSALDLSRITFEVPPERSASINNLPLSEPQIVDNPNAVSLDPPRSREGRTFVTNMWKKAAAKIERRWTAISNAVSTWRIRDPYQQEQRRMPHARHFSYTPRPLVRHKTKQNVIGKSTQSTESFTTMESA